MLNLQEIKEAIKIQNDEWEIHYKDFPSELSTEGFKEQGRSLKTLLNLAELVVGCSEVMPKYIGVDELNHSCDLSGCSACYNKGHDEAINKIPIVLAKKMVGLEEVIQDKIYEGEDGEGNWQMYANAEEIATAIRKYMKRNLPSHCVYGG